MRFKILNRRFGVYTPMEYYWLIYFHKLAVLAFEPPSIPIRMKLKNVNQLYQKSNTWHAI